MELNDDNILDQSDYLELICTSINPIYESIGDYFFMKYNEHVTINHNFINGLKKALESLHDKFKEDIELKILKNISVNKKQKWGDFSIYLHYNKIFYDFQIQQNESQFPLPHTEQVLAKKRTTINKLYEGYDYFIKLVEEKDQNSSKQAKIKLNWGLKTNQLYVLIRELKNQGIIKNTNEELAEILKNNVQQLSGVAKSTILKEISRNIQLPKNKRVKVTIGDSKKI